jgi:hypothetical protein
MAWVKLDDGFSDHPKVIEAGPLAAWLFVRALCYASKHLTDGFISHAAVDVLAGGGARKQVRRLLDAGLFKEEPTGVRIHNYLKWQPLGAEVKARRAATLERVRKCRNNAVTDSVTPAPAEPSVTPSVTRYNGVRNSVTPKTVTPPVTRYPPGADARARVPSRPVPSPEEDLKQNHHAPIQLLTSADAEFEREPEVARQTSERKICELAQQNGAASPSRKRRDSGLQRGDFSLKKSVKKGKNT